jgi:hypothetical protein
LGPFRPEAALVAALLVSGCAGAEAPLRREVEAARAELAETRRENQALRTTVETLTERVEALAARLGPGSSEGGAPGQGPAQPGAPAGPAAVPAGLAVVRLEPARRPSEAPSVPTSVPIAELDPGRLQTLARQGGRDLANDAELELRAARRKDGVARAHALEDVVARYPHHPQAGQALVEASRAYADAGRSEASCTLARRAVDEYPAGRAIAEALWQLAGCEASRAGPEAEARLLTRLVTEFPSTPVGRKAVERLAVLSGRSGGVAPPASPARSSP